MLWVFQAPASTPKKSTGSGTSLNSQTSSRSAARHLQAGGLGQANVLARGGGVAVERAECDLVEVNQPQPPDARAQQQVRRVAAHALPQAALPQPAAFW